MNSTTVDRPRAATRAAWLGALCIVAALLGAAPSARGADETPVPLEEVPAAARQAALDAVPGLVLERASRETEDGHEIYELEGTADGVEVEVEVTPDGEVLEIERETAGAG